MNLPTLSNHKLLSVLLSAIFGFSAAAGIGLSIFHISTLPLREQVWVLILLGFSLSSVFYILPARLFRRFYNCFPETKLDFGAALRKIFFAAFLFFPMALIGLAQAREFLRIMLHRQATDFIGWLPRVPADRFLLGMSLALVLCILVFAWQAGNKPQIMKRLSMLPDAYYVGLVVFVAIALRLPGMASVHTQPVSNFGIIHEDALLFAYGLPMRVQVTTHVLITLIYGILYGVFGSQLVILKLFNSTVYALAGVFLYYAGKELFASKLWAAMAGLTLTALPALVLYSNVLTPEHMFLLVECALLLVVVRFYRARERMPLSAWQYGAWSLCLGSLIGLLGMFRPFSELFLVALLGTLVVYGMDWKAFAVSAFCLLLTFFMFRQAQNLLANVYQNEFLRIRPCNLLVGMNFSTYGQYNTKDTELCDQLALENPDDGLFARKVMDISLQRVQEHRDSLPRFVNKKMAILWTNSNGLLYWVFKLPEAENPQPALRLAPKANLVDFAIMLIITVTCTLGVLLALLQDTRPVILLCMLVLFGFHLMEIAFELQTRYRSVMMPLLIFIAFWAIATLHTTVKGRIPG